MQHKIDIYNDFASEYAKLVVAREKAGIERDPIMPRFLDTIGDVSGLSVLDAVCGEGYISRILVSCGAQVTGIDIAPNLIEIARAKDPDGTISYQVADLSQPQPAYAGRFDLAVSHLALNDVHDYQGFLTTLGTMIKSGGRLVLSMNSPYSYVIRGHVANYFDSGKAFSYRGMAEEGVKVHFYQRTLEEYIDACVAAGFQLRRLIDVPTPEGTFKRRNDTLLPMGRQFPFFMILSLVRA